MNRVVFSRKSDNWATPKALLADLEAEFGAFDFDPCPFSPKFRDTNGLMKEWFGKVFINPPYSEIGKWVARASAEINHGKPKLIIMLLPARTDTKWFHEYIYGKAEIRFIKGRLKFEGGAYSAPFPSMIVILKKI